MNKPKKILLLDYDNTLSPFLSDGLMELDSLITQFISENIGLEPHQANLLRQTYNSEFGSTLGGLIKHHSTSPHDFFDFIQDIKSKNLPKKDSALKFWLNNQKIPISIFTNARADWAIKGLTSMGLIKENAPFYDHLFDLEYLDWVGKPNKQAYDQVESGLSQKHGSNLEIIFVDDSLPNLDAAKQKGWTTIWVHPKPKDSNPNHLDHLHYSQLMDLPFFDV